MPLQREARGLVVGGDMLAQGHFRQEAFRLFAQLARLRADPETRAIPVVAASASVTPSERERVTASGFDGYVAKPIDVPTFGDTIERFLAKSPA